MIRCIFGFICTKCVRFDAVFREGLFMKTIECDVFSKDEGASKDGPGADANGDICLSLWWHMHIYRH